MKKNKKNFNKRNLKQKQKGLVAGSLAFALALSGTFAFLTDRASYNESIDGAKFGIKVEGDTDNSTVVMPDHPRDFNYTITSTGTVDADIRERVMVYGLKEDETTHDLSYIDVSEDNQEFGLYDDDGSDFADAKIVGKDAVLYSKLSELDAGGSVTESGQIKLNPSATNEYSDRNYVISILVEAKQKKSADWNVVAVENINMGVESMGNAINMQNMFNMVDAVAKGSSIDVTPDTPVQSDKSVAHKYIVNVNNTGTDFGEGEDYPYMYNPSISLVVNNNGSKEVETVSTYGEDSLTIEEGKYNEDAYVEAVRVITKSKNPDNEWQPLQTTTDIAVDNQVKIYDVALSEDHTSIGAYWDVDVNFTDAQPQTATISEKEIESNKILEITQYPENDNETSNPVELNISAKLSDGYSIKCETTGDTVSYDYANMNGYYSVTENNTYVFKIYDAQGNAVDGTEKSITVSNYNPYALSGIGFSVYPNMSGAGSLFVSMSYNSKITSVKAYYAETGDGDREEVALDDANAPTAEKMYGSYSATVNKSGYYFLVIGLDNGTTKEFQQQLTLSTSTVYNAPIISNLSVNNGVVSATIDTENTNGLGVIVKIINSDTDSVVSQTDMIGADGSVTLSVSESGNYILRAITTDIYGMETTASSEQTFSATVITISAPKIVNPQAAADGSGLITADIITSSNTPVLVKLTKYEYDSETETYSKVVVDTKRFDTGNGTYNYTVDKSDMYEIEAIALNPTTFEETNEIDICSVNPIVYKTATPVIANVKAYTDGTEIRATITSSTGGNVKIELINISTGDVVDDTIYADLSDGEYEHSWSAEDGNYILNVVAVDPNNETIGDAVSYSIHKVTYREPSLSDFSNADNTISFTVNSNHNGPVRVKLYNGTTLVETKDFTSEGGVYTHSDLVSGDTYVARLIALDPDTNLETDSMCYIETNIE